MSNYITITLLNIDTDSFYYLSCGINGCKKKVVQTTKDNATNYYCEKCQKICIHSKPRYLLKADIADETNQLSVLIPDEQAKKILNCPVEYLLTLFGNKPDEAYSKLLEPTQMKFNILLNMKSNKFNNIVKKQYFVNDLKKY